MAAPPDETPFTPVPANDDAHGHAALRLVESLIHSLVARGALSVASAVEVVEVALDAQIAINEDAHQPTLAQSGATALLTSIRASLQIDLRP